MCFCLFGTEVGFAQRLGHYGKAAMKRCPLCEKIYGNELLRFCRFDGSRLIDVSWWEAPTIRFDAHEIASQTGGLHVDSATGELKAHGFR